MENEIDYGKVFGTEGDSPEEGAEEQEAAEPEAGTEPSGEKGQETAEPADDETDHPQRRQSQEDNRRYAAMRRRTEQEARDRASREVDAAIAAASIVDPRTGRPVRTRAELEACRAGGRAEKGGGLAPAEYRRPAGEPPEVKAARQALAYAQETEIHRKVEDQVRQISRMDPSIREKGDLSRLSCYEQMCRMVEKGYELADAYRVLNFDELLRRNEAAARQAALNSVSGKSHMAQRKPRGEGGAYVPPDVAEEYRLFLPGITDAEIQAHYNRYAKSRKAD